MTITLLNDVETIAYVEETTPSYKAQLVDIDNNPVPGDVLDTLTLKYYQEYTEAIIHGRNAQSVHNANDVTLDDTGLLRWRLRPEDTVILDDALHQEPHIALFEFSYAGPAGTEYGKHQVRFLIANLSRVP
jgi:hypothetical protein